MIVSTITPEELADTLVMAQRRTNFASANCIQEQYGCDREVNTSSDRTGCIGEFAVAKQFGLPWDGHVGRIGATDVGPFEVRSTPRPDGNLLLHPRDAPQKKFICARTYKVWTTGEVFLIGWAYGYEAQKQRYWRDDRAMRHPCFVYPARKLRRMETLYDD